MSPSPGEYVEVLYKTAKRRWDKVKGVVQPVKNGSKFFMIDTGSYKMSFLNVDLKLGEIKVRKL